jgi:hypothetical protein
MRGFSRFVIASAAIAAIAGCSDSTTSPREATVREIAPGDGPSLDYSGPSRFFGIKSTSFTVTAAGGTFAIGDLYTLTIPAGAVCIPGTNYGPGTWDLPCTTLREGQSVKVTASYGFANNGPVVDFSPDMRFSPTKQVTLSTSLFAPVLTTFRAFFQANPTALRYFSIYYTPDFGNTRVSDAALDPSLTTHINLKTGEVWRRIKHFSGYNQTSGLACDLESGDADCKANPPPIVDMP